MAIIVRALWLAAELTLFSYNDRALWNFFSAQRLFWIVSKATNAWGNNGQSKTIFSILKEKLAYIYFYSKRMSDEESHSAKANVGNYFRNFYCIIFRNIAKKGHIIRNLLTSLVRSLQGNLRPRPRCINPAIARSIHQGLGLRFLCND